MLIVVGIISLKNSAIRKYHDGWLFRVRARDFSQLSATLL